ncbi:MAG TPA: ABC transporter permease, partial [Thermoplasmata archaeon]|nr:ABC transporter permease [Thermoplasmata archaeon]
MNRLTDLFRRGFAENVRFGVSAIREHKLRSGLTILGIVVGVATVIAMVAIVTGFNNNVIGNFQAFGASRIEFKKYKDRFGPPGPGSEEERRRRNLTMDDVLAIRKACPEAAAVSALVGYFDAEIHVKNGSLEANNPYVLGVDEYYPIATAYTIGLGRFFTPAEIEHGSLGVVLGSEVREAIFPAEHPLGKEITVNGLRYRVIGVLEKKGEQFGYSPDNKVVLPYKTFEHQFGYQVRQGGVNINAVPRRPEDVDVVIEKATAVLRLRRRIPFNKPNDFEIGTPAQLIGQFRAITGGVSGAMILIALISLAVGGVGVMNIMLVSVTQRTREIGIRKAVGAFRRDIVRQFLTEAV